MEPEEPGRAPPDSRSRMRKAAVTWTLVCLAVPAVLVGLYAVTGLGAAGPGSGIGSARWLLTLAATLFYLCAAPVWFFGLLAITIGISRQRTRHAPTATSDRRVVPLADYDSALQAELKSLPPRTRAAFASACAERLYPAYAAFVQASGRDDQGLVRRTLDFAWEGARSGTLPVADPAELFDRCVALIPGDDSDADPIPAHADDAIASVAYALQAAANLDEMAAGRAAQRVTDCLDDFLLSNDIDASQPNPEKLVWDHPLIRDEINRREQDLRRLAGSSDWGAAVDEVRARATGLSALPIDRLDHQAS